MWIAALIVVGQGAIIATLLVFVRTFGSYTKALEDAHKSNMLVYGQALKLLEYVQHKEAA